MVDQMAGWLVLALDESWVAPLVASTVELMVGNLVEMWAVPMVDEMAVRKVALKVE